VAGDVATVSTQGTLDALADATLARFARPDDDALVLLARTIADDR